MKTKKTLMLVSSICLVLLLIAVVGDLKEGWSAPPAKPIELNFAHYIPAAHWGHKEIFVRWAKEVDKATKGKVKITIYPAQTLLKARETYDGIQRGTADIGIAFASFNPGRFPLSESSGLPLGIPTSNIGSHAYWKLYKKFLEFQKEYSAVKILAITCTAPAKLLTKKPIRSLEDIKGMKIRVPGKWEAKTVAKLGATPIFLPTSEIYMSMERGVINGAVVPYDTLLGFKLYELVKDITDVSLCQVVMYTAMNLNTWNSLPSDIKEKIDKVSGTHLVEYASNAFDKYNRLGKELCAKKGISIHKLSEMEAAKWEAIFQSVTNDWVADTEQKGLPGKKFLDELQRLVEKH